MMDDSIKENTIKVLRTSNSDAYRCCSVPLCTNTSLKTPGKLFIFVPYNQTIRNEWLKMARRDLEGILPTTQLYFCEDHFDLPNDMENYIHYRIQGFVSQIRMKPGCVPMRFDCQSHMRQAKSKAKRHSPKTYFNRKTIDKGKDQYTSTSDDDFGHSDKGVVTSACRVCLAVNVRVYTISGLLQQVFEKLTGTDLVTADDRPVTACYMCHPKLEQCRDLMLTCRRAENVLNGLLKENAKLNLNSLSKVDREANGLSCRLTITETCYDTIPENTDQINLNSLSETDCYDYLRETTYQVKEQTNSGDEIVCSFLEMNSDFKEKKNSDDEMDCSFLEMKSDLKIEYTDDITIEHNYFTKDTPEIEVRTDADYKLPNGDVKIDEIKEESSDEAEKYLTFETHCSETFLPHKHEITCRRADNVLNGLVKENAKVKEETNSGDEIVCSFLEMNSDFKIEYTDDITIEHNYFTKDTPEIEVRTDADYKLPNGDVKIEEIKEESSDEAEKYLTFETNCSQTFSPHKHGIYTLGKRKTPEDDKNITVNVESNVKLKSGRKRNTTEYIEAIKKQMLDDQNISIKVTNPESDADQAIKQIKKIPQVI